MNAVRARTSAFVYLIGVVGSLLIVAWLVRTMAEKTRPQPLGQSRAAERAKNLTELRAAASDQLQNYGWVDQNRGLVRLPIDRAMELTVQQWKNPAQARSNLLKRIEKASAPAPEKPNQFE